MTILVILFIKIYIREVITVEIYHRALNLLLYVDMLWRRDLAHLICTLFFFLINVGYHWELRVAFYVYYCVYPTKIYHIIMSAY